MNRRYMTIIMLLLSTCVLVLVWRNTWINTVSIGRDDDLLVHGFFEAESFAGQYMRWSTDVATVRVLHPSPGLAVATVHLLNSYPRGIPQPQVTLWWSNTPPLLINTIEPGYTRRYMSLVRSTIALPWYKELTIKSTTWTSLNDSRGLGVVVSAVGLNATTLMLPMPAPVIVGVGFLLILLVIVLCQSVFAQQIWQITISAIVAVGIIYAGVVQPYRIQPFLVEGVVGAAGVYLLTILRNHNAYVNFNWRRYYDYIYDLIKSIGKYNRKKLLAGNKLNMLYIAICSVIIATLTILVSPLIINYHIQTLLSGGIKRSSSTGVIKTSIEPYKTSPFGVDYVIEGSASVSQIFYSTGIANADRASGDVAETTTVFLSRPTNIDVTYVLDDITTARRPRVFVYNDISRLVESGNLESTTVAFDSLTNPYRVTLKLEAGLYRLRHMFMREDVASITLKFTPSADSKDIIDFDSYVLKNTKTLHFDIMPGQMVRLSELRNAQEINWARLPTGDWKNRFLPGPKESIQVRIRSELGDWSFAELKLSGRNAAHYSKGGLPSADISIKAGELPYGLKKFKLYVIQSKSGGVDMYMERLINDMGLPINREDLVRIVVNGEIFGYMQLYEDFDTSMFEAGQYVEGPVIGYDTDSLIATKGHSWFVPRSYYGSSEIKVDQEIDIGTLDMSRRLCPFSMGNTLAMGVFYNGMHGLGADTRFLFDFRRNCVNPVYKDFNIGVFALSNDYKINNSRFADHPSLMALRLFSVLTPSWRPYTPTYASYFVTRHEDKPDQQGEYFYWTVTPPVMNYANVPEFDGEFLMAMERIYGVAHTDRFTSRLDNFYRAAKLLNTQPRESQDVLTNMKLKVLRDMMPFSTIKELMNVPSQCDDSYIKNLIRNASKGVTNPDCRDIHRLAWRNDVVQGYLQSVPVTTDPPDQVGLMMTNIKQQTSNMTFLYQKDRGDFADLFFVERGCVNLCNGTLWLTDDETQQTIQASNIYDDGTIDRSLTEMDLLLQNVATDEKVRVVYFSVPKRNRYQHLIPHYEGAGQYYGSYGIAVMPLTSYPNHVKSITTAASIVAPTPIETFFEVTGDTLVWKENQSVPDQKIYIPSGYTWKIEKPLTISLAKHGCFEVWGNVEIATDAKLELTDNGNGWSGIRFFSNRDLNLQNLYVNNGGYNEEFVYCGSRRYTGILGFYETTVHLKNVHITHNMSEDGMHLVHTDMILEDSSITGTVSDAVDSDYSSVVFRNFTIDGAGALGENGGDSLDFSGSLAELHGMHLYNSSDKGISVGENSVVHVFDSEMEGGNFGIAIKDASSLMVKGTTITGAKTGIGLYSKKPYYPRPTFDIDTQDVKFFDVGVTYNPEASPD
jgi:hypothetical protein